MTYQRYQCCLNIHQHLHHHYHKHLEMRIHDAMFIDIFSLITTIIGIHVILNKVGSISHRNAFIVIQRRSNLPVFTCRSLERRHDSTQTVLSTGYQRVPTENGDFHDDEKMIALGHVNTAVKKTRLKKVRLSTLYFRMKAVRYIDVKKITAICVLILAINVRAVTVRVVFGSTVSILKREVKCFLYK